MKVIIAGSRNIDNYNSVCAAVKKSNFNITEVVSGTAKGVDKLGEKWAQENGVKITRFPAQWDKFGKSAGPIRNEQMALYADALIAIWDGKSAGTNNMIKNAEKHKLQIFLMEISHASQY